MDTVNKGTYKLTDYLEGLGWIEIRFNDGEAFAGMVRSLNSDTVEVVVNGEPRWFSLQGLKGE